LGYEIIVAADGDDGTREIAAELGRKNPQIRVIGEKVRRGKGRGIREAVRIAKCSVIGFADADNKVPIEEFDKVGPLLSETCPVVIGSRALNRGLIEKAQPLYRRMGAIGFRIFMRAATGLRDVSDTQCGFKFFLHDVAKQVFAMQKIDGYMYDVEILLLVRRLGMSIREVPVRWRDDGDSRLQLISGNARNVRDILRIRLETRAAVHAHRAVVQAARTGSPD
jgi:dolichyl-phosphate beta-glucosyltransferase